ncbi:hypothetical protein EB001_27465, partial [bacterium]|nr:hypothetical protein [bacterium]
MKVTLDYEDIKDGPTVFENYGNITEGSSAYFNYESVADTDIVYPYGGFNITGEVQETFAPILAWRGSGSISVTGQVYIVFNLSAKSKPIFNDTIEISGTSRCLFSFAHIGSGSVFNIGKKIERATYSYNESSVASFSSSDYEYVASAVDTTIDSGLISEVSVGDINLGYIINQETLYPYGRFTFVGQSSVEFYRRPSYVGSG